MAKLYQRGDSPSADDGTRRLFHDAVRQFNDAEERRRSMEREVARYLPHVRMNLLNTVQFQWNQSLPPKYDFFTELREIMYQANLKAVPLEEEARNKSSKSQDGRALSKPATRMPLMSDSESPTSPPAQTRALKLLEHLANKSGNTRAIFNAIQIGAELGFSEEESRRANNWLQEQGLVSTTPGADSAITDAGRDEVEALQVTWKSSPKIFGMGVGQITGRVLIAILIYVAIWFFRRGDMRNIQDNLLTSLVWTPVGPLAAFSDKIFGWMWGKR